MTPGQKAGASLSVILAACGMAATMLVDREGWKTTSYPDPAKGAALPTACAGVTAGVKLHQTYTQDECVMLTAVAMVEHGVGIDRCIKRPIPLEMRAAFTDFAYNMGVAKFCGSTMAAKMNAGDLAGACNELPKWVYGGHVVMPGLVAGRARELALCRKGLETEVAG